MAKSRTTAKGLKPQPSPAAEAPRFVCIHGHFYQPPRENPWLETVEVQDSAAPYHDWNDRITAECYAPNGASRITNKQDEIIRIMNNYARISYNFGPTLLSWLHDKAPSVTADTAPPWPRSTTTSSCPSRTSAMPSPRSAGASPTSNSASAENPKACGSPKPPSTAACSTSWPRRASSSPSSPPSSAPASASSPPQIQIQIRVPSPKPPKPRKSPGPKLPTPPSTPPTPTSSIST